MNEELTTKGTKSTKTKAYPKYKPSGVEWLGDVPEHWGVKRLKFIVQESLQYGANEAAELDDPDLPRFVRITDVDEHGNLREDTFRSLPEEIAKPFLLKEGDLLFARSGATVGKTFFYQKSWGRAAYAGYLIRARLNRKIVVPNFINQITKTGFYQQWIQSMLIQATIQNVNAEKYASFVVTLPPLPEQQAIASFLDRETGRIDSLIGKKQQLLQMLAEQRTALISRAVTKGLDSSVKLKPSGVEWLGDVPEHWGVKRLKYQVTINDETLPETTDPDYELLYVDIRSVDPTQGIVQKEQMVFENAPSRARRNVKDGDTIVSTVRTYLRAISPVIEPEENLIVSTGFAVIRPKKINQDYLSAAIRAPYFIEEVVSRSVGVSYPAINASEIGLISIPLPPLPEQQAIAAYLDCETAKIDTLSAKVGTVIEQLKEYRTALISSAVTGKIDVQEAA